MYRKIAAITIQIPPAARLPEDHMNYGSQLLDESGMLLSSIDIAMNTLLYNDYHHRLAGEYDAEVWKLWERLRRIHSRAKTRWDRRYATLKAGAR